MGSPTKTCALPECKEKFPADNRRKYCTTTHRSRAIDRRKRATARAKAQRAHEVAPTPLVNANRASKGRVYELLKEHPDWIEGYRAKLITQNDLAALCQGTQAEVNQALAQISIDEARAYEAANWDGPPDEATESLESFSAFRDRYFKTERGEVYTTEPFHQRWIDAILETMDTGGRLMILSPPRHGKTQLLLHFCVWQIVKNPHIRIVWLAGNKDLAQDWIASVEEELENNEQLALDFLPPGGSFRPGSRSRRSWSRDQFTVDTRIYNVKSPTMVAMSRGSKILSRDADIIIADDIEDHPSTIQPSNRLQTRNWWTTEVGSRKEHHTAQIVIGSRQHPDDLYSHLLESDAWECIVESAHAEECDLPEIDKEAHVDCMLWSKRHPYAWLMDQLAAAETTGGRGMWEMVYLNRPVAEGLMMFNRDAVLNARDFDRDLYDVPSDAILIAGLDPSGTGYQASFLWAYDPKTRKVYMVDTENDKGGGIPRARQQVEHWFDGLVERPLYCRKWVVETNLYKNAIVQDEILRRYCLDRQIELIPHTTDGTNKWDPAMGVSSLNTWFEQGMIVLPYGSPRAQAKSDAFIRQLLNFASNALKGTRRRTTTSDLVMAAWFPFPHIQYLDHSRVAGMSVEYNPTYRGLTTGKSMFTYTSKAYNQ